jgi:hypothetical protein
MFCLILVVGLLLACAYKIIKNLSNYSQKLLALALRVCLI